MTDELMAELKKLAKRYHPRKDLVFFKEVTIDKSAGGVVIPEISIEGKAWYVISAGPDVDDLKTGDRIMVIGTLRQDLMPLPGAKDLLVARQQNCLMKIEE